jgi:hypothetical protein
MEKETFTGDLKTAEYASLSSWRASRGLSSGDFQVRWFFGAIRLSIKNPKTP